MVACGKAEVQHTVWGAAVVAGAVGEVGEEDGGVGGCGG